MAGAGCLASWLARERTCALDALVACPDEPFPPADKRPELVRRGPNLRASGADLAFGSTFSVSSLWLERWRKLPDFSGLLEEALSEGRERADDLRNTIELVVRQVELSQVA